MYRFCILALACLAATYGGALRGDTDLCTYCTDFTNNLKMAMASKYTTDMMHLANKEICSSVTANADAADACTKAANAIFDLMQQKTQQLFDPDAVCHYYGFCANNFASFLTGDDDKCQYCTDFCSNLKEFCASDSAYDMIITLTKEICAMSASPDNVEGCERVSKSIVDELRAGTQKYFHPDAVCRHTGFCKSTTVTADSDMCVYCKDFANNLKDSMGSKYTREMFHLANKELCYLTTEDAKEALDCTNTANSIWDLMAEKTQQYFNPEASCAYFGFCKADNPLLQYLSSPDDDLCEYCTDFCTALKEGMGSKHTHDMLVTFVTETCAAVAPSSQQTLCVTVSTEIIGMMQLYTQKYFDPAATCKFYGFCKASFF